MGRTRDSEISQRYADLVHEEIALAPKGLWQARARRVMILARDRMLEIQSRGEELSDVQQEVLRKAERLLAETEDVDD